MFTTTHWSVVLAANQPDTSAARDALERLCQGYWYPLYAFVRRQGYSPEDAQDLTQGFFARLLEKNYLGQVERNKGRFRSFLLASFKHFLADEWDKARAQKRGGGRPLASLDDSSGEARYCLEPASGMDAETLFDRRWAMTVLEQAEARLKEEYANGRKAQIYERLKLFESGEDQHPPYSQLAVELGLSEGGVKCAVSRMRARYRELIREEVANTVSNPADLDDEIRHLISIVTS